MAQLTTYQPGSYDLAAKTVNGPCYGFIVTYDVSAWGAGRAVFTILVSQDDGATWQPGGGAGVTGPSPFIGRNGTITTGSFQMQTSAHEYDASDKFVKLKSVYRQDGLRIKVQMVVSGAPVRTDVDVDLIRTINQPTNVPDAHHSIALGVHAQGRGDDTVDFIDTSAGVSTSSGSLLIVDAMYYTGFFDGIATPAFSSITDTKSNSWTNNVAEYAHGNGIKAQERYTTGGTGGLRGSSHTFRLTMTYHNAYPTVTVTEYTGQAAAPLDKTDTYIDSGQTTHADSTWTTGTLATQPEMVHFYGGVTGAAHPAVSGAWTQIEAADHAGGSNEGFITAYQRVTATTAVLPTYTTSNAVDTVNHVSTWKELVSYLLTASGKTTAGAGVAGTVRKGYPITASPKAVSAAGIGATLRATFVIAASVKAASCTGATATVGRAFPLTASLKAAAGAGVAASVFKGYPLTASPATASAAGVAATLRASFVVIGGERTTTGVGDSAALRVARVLAGTEATVVAVGIDATLTYGVAHNDYVLTAIGGVALGVGESAALRADRTLAAALKAGTAAGIAATVRKGYPITASRATASATGEAAAVRLARRIAATEGEAHGVGVVAALRYTPVGGVQFQWNGMPRAAIGGVNGIDLADLKSINGMPV